MCRVGGRHYRPGACFKLKGVKKKKRVRLHEQWPVEVRVFLFTTFLHQTDWRPQVKDVNYFYIGIRHQQSPVSTKENEVTLTYNHLMNKSLKRDQKRQFVWHTSKNKRNC